MTAKFVMVELVPKQSPSSIAELRGDLTLTTRTSKIPTQFVKDRDDHHTTFEFILAKMEQDRAQTDVGKAVDAEFNAENQQKQRQPRKRFIGRKEAAAERRADTNETIEDSGAIQGISRAASKPCAFVTDVL